MGTVRIFTPPIRSGAPPSSVLMCADSAAITAPQRGSIACRATTFAPVPLNVGYTSTGALRVWLRDSCSAAV